MRREMQQIVVTRRDIVEQSWTIRRHEGKKKQVVGKA